MEFQNHIQDIKSHNSSLIAENESLKSKINKRNANIKRIQGDIKTVSSEVKKIQSKITPALIKDLYTLLEKKSPPALIAVLEAMVGLLRNSENANKIDVELYTKKH